MRVGSLFSGVGGFDLGLQRAGMTIAWQVEIDPLARAVLEKHWPDVPKFGDIRELSGDELESVDLICGGPPCQPISSAGLKRASKDERWLWPDFLRLVRRLRPRYVLMENPSDLLVRGFGAILGALAASGYDAEWQVLPAAAFGLPHRRWRLFAVAYPGGDRREVGAQRDGRTQGSPSIWPARWDYADGLALAARSASEAAGRVVGMADGVSGRVDRYRGRRIAALGNAVVPQVAEWIGRRILAHEARREVT